MFRGTFYGQKISDYGRENGRVDYFALAHSFDNVLCNGILNYREGWDDWEQISGLVDNSEAIEELKAELEDLEAKITEATKAKKDAELAYDKADSAYDNISEILEKFDSFEYDYNELDEALRWNDTETPSGEELCVDDITNELDCLNWWGMREVIERHQNTAEEERDEAEERFEGLEEEVEKLTKRKAEIEEQIEELEVEDTTEAEVFQWYIISDNGAQIIQNNAPSEILYYNSELDIYVWGVTHWGTGWTHVLTSIPCETFEEQKQREEAEASEAFATKMQDEYDRIKAESEANALEEATEDSIEIVEEVPTEDEALTKERRTLDAWTVFIKVDKAIMDEVERIEHENDYFYAKECERLMKHRFECFDIVAFEAGGMPYTVTAKGSTLDTIEIENEDGTQTVNRFDVFGFSSEGEEVRTPCTDEELAVLKANCAWC